jgi:hypothetical protein
MEFSLFSYIPVKEMNVVAHEFKRLFPGNALLSWFIQANLHLSWSSHFARLCHWGSEVLL